MRKQAIQCRQTNVYEPKTAISSISAQDLFFRHCRPDNCRSTNSLGPIPDLSSPCLISFHPLLLDRMAQCLPRTVQFFHRKSAPNTHRNRYYSSQIDFLKHPLTLAPRGDPSARVKSPSRLSWSASTATYANAALPSQRNSRSSLLFFLHSQRSL